MSRRACAVRTVWRQICAIAPTSPEDKVANRCNFKASRSCTPRLRFEPPEENASRCTWSLTYVIPAWAGQPVFASFQLAEGQCKMKQDRVVAGSAILVVEDEYLIADDLARELEAHGFLVI